MWSTRRLIPAGPALVLAYCVINSVKSVYEGSLVQHLSPEFLAFNCFILAQIFYLAICGSKRSLVASARKSLPDILGYNVSTTVSWVAVLYAFTAFEPVIANSIIVGLVPSLTILLAPLLRSTVRVLSLEKVAAGAVIGAMIYLIVVARDGASAIGALPPSKLTLGLIACGLTAAAVAANTYFAKRLSESGMHPKQIMASRFVVLIAATFGTLTWRHSFSTYTVQNVSGMLTISIVGIIVSLYLLQQGIVRTEPITVSLLFGVNLIITYVAQFFDPRLHQTSSTLIGIVILSAAMCLGAWARRGASRSPRNEATAALDSPARASGRRSS